MISQFAKYYYDCKISFYAYYLMKKKKCFNICMYVE